MYTALYVYNLNIKHTVLVLLKYTVPFDIHELEHWSDLFKHVYDSKEK